MLAESVDVDGRRWRQAEQGYMDEPLDAVPQEHIVCSSKGLPWHGLSLWHQRSGAEDLYIPAAGKHCIIVRQGSGTGLYQRHGNASQWRRWETGEVVILPAHTPSFWRTEQGRDNLHLDLSPQWLQRVHGEDAPHLALRSCFGTRDPVLQQLVHVLMLALGDNSALHSAFADGIATSVAVHLLEHYRAPASRSERSTPLSARQLQHVADFVNAHIGQPLTPATLAQEVRLSVFHFSRCLKFSSGLTPHQFVLRIRMERAREMLSNTRMPVSEIACTLGFSSASYFSQAFAKHWGVTPLQMRQHF
jgi:AraC family transcriptional regulator